MAILGVPSNSLISLGLEDSKLMQHQPKAAERIVQILLEIRPVEAYVTYRNDFNEDHRVTHAIVKHSVRETGLLTRIYEYPVWNKKVPGPDLKVVLMDIHNELSRKMEAISKYASQISKPFPGQERTVLSEDFLKMFSSDKELFYTEEC